MPRSIRNFWSVLFIPDTGSHSECLSAWSAPFRRRSLLCRGGCHLPANSSIEFSVNGLVPKKTLRNAFASRRVASYPQSFNADFTGIVALSRPCDAGCGDSENFRSPSCTGFPQDSQQISTILNPCKSAAYVGSLI